MLKTHIFWGIFLKFWKKLQDFEKNSRLLKKTQGYGVGLTQSDSIKSVKKMPDLKPYIFALSLYLALSTRWSSIFPQWAFLVRLDQNWCCLHNFPSWTIASQLHKVERHLSLTFHLSQSRRRLLMVKWNHILSHFLRATVGGNNLLF